MERPSPPAAPTPGLSAGSPPVDGGPASAAPPTIGTVTLVEAKLAPPTLRPDVLPRERLVRRLLETRDESLISLIAPAGYGKTTILALWRGRETRPVAWLTVDEADADPVRFFAHLAAALSRGGGPDLSDVDLGLVSGGVLSTVVPHLSSALLRAGRPLLIMLDDVHVLDGTPTIDALTMLVDYLAPGVSIALAGRGDAGLPLARLRATGRLLDLTAADLSFDAQESASLAALRGRELDEPRVRAIHDATEGWPAAVYLVLRRTEPGVTGDAATPAPSGRDTDIGAYIDAELLGRTTPRVRAFMLRTSVLDRLTAGLCDEVAGIRGSDTLLRSLAAQNQLVVPLDMQGGWYRYHPLLRDHLLGRLEREQGAAEAHHRAAAWYARNGMGDVAVEHLFAAGDPDAAAAMATPLMLPLYRRGREATTRRWIDRLTDAELRRNPQMAVSGALSAALEGRADAARRLAGLADAAEYAGARPAGAEGYEAARLTLRAMMAPRGIRAAIADAEAAAAGAPEWSDWGPSSRFVHGAILAVAGDRDQGDAVLLDAVRAARAQGAGRSDVVATSWRAMIAIERDDWAAVDRLAREGLETAERYAHELDATAASIAVVGARAAMRRGDVAGSGRLMAAFQVARSSLGPATPWLSVRCLLEAARAQLALADPAGARACLAQALDIVGQGTDLGDLPERVHALRDQIRHLPPGPAGASTLTPAEVRVLRLLPTYLTASEMADRLYVSTNTVRTQIQSLYGKLGAVSRAEAVERAIEAGLLEPLPVLTDRPITSR